MSIAIITGVTSGIGQAASYLLPDLGYKTIYLVGRNQRKLESLKIDLNQKHKDLDLIIKVADLSDFKQVQTLAQELFVETKESGIDLFLNNAGLGQDRRSENTQGFELHLATNYLSQVILSEKLFPNLNKDSFTIFTSSYAYMGAKVDFDNMNLEQNFSMIKAYANSKAYQMMYAKLLRTRLETQNPKNLHFEAIHPGFVRTGFGKSDTSLLIKIFLWLSRPLTLSPEQSASHNLLSPIYPQNQEDLGKADIWSNGKPVVTKKSFMELENLKKLWKYTEKSLEKYL